MNNKKETQLKMQKTCTWKQQISGIQFDNLGIKWCFRR